MNYEIVLKGKIYPAKHKLIYVKEKTLKAFEYNIIRNTNETSGIIEGVQLSNGDGFEITALKGNKGKSDSMIGEWKILRNNKNNEQTEFEKNHNVDLLWIFNHKNVYDVMNIFGIRDSSDNFKKSFGYLIKKNTQKKFIEKKIPENDSVFSFKKKQKKFISCQKEIKKYEEDELSSTVKTRKSEFEEIHTCPILNKTCFEIKIGYSNNRVALDDFKKNNILEKISNHSKKVNNTFQSLPIFISRKVEKKIKEKPSKTFLIGELQGGFLKGSYERDTTNGKKKIIFEYIDIHDIIFIDNLCSESFSVDNVLDEYQERSDIFGLFFAISEADYNSVLKVFDKKCDIMIFLMNNDQLNFYNVKIKDRQQQNVYQYFLYENE